MVREHTHGLTGRSTKGSTRTVYPMDKELTHGPTGRITKGSIRRVTRMVRELTHMQTRVSTKGSSGVARIGILFFMTRMAIWPGGLVKGNGMRRNEG